MDISQNKQPLKQTKDESFPKENIVKSIFDPKEKKKEPSSLFRPKEDITSSKISVDKKTPEAIKISIKTDGKSLRKIRYKAPLPLGIDLGFGAIKIAQLCYGDKNPIITKLILKELPFDLIENPVERKRLLPKLLKEVLEENRIKGPAFSTVPIESIQIKNIFLPRMPLSEIDGAIKWEIRQSTGPDFDNTCFDYFILNEGKIKTLDRIHVLAVSAQKKEIMNHVSLLESAGLKVEAVETESFSLASCLEFNQLIPEGQVAIVLDFGANCVKLSIIEDQELHFTRALSMSGHLITAAIKDYCQTSYKEAEDLKKRIGLFHDSSETRQAKPQIHNAITLLLEKLVSDIEHSFKHYSYQLTKSLTTHYGKIILTGGGANLPFLTLFLEERLKVSVEIHDPLKEFQVDDKVFTSLKDLSKDSVPFGVALGLALRAWESKSSKKKAF